MMHSEPMQNDDDDEVRRNITPRQVRILSVIPMFVLLVLPSKHKNLHHHKSNEKYE